MSFELDAPVSLRRFGPERAEENHGWKVWAINANGRQYTLIHPMGGFTNAHESEMVAAREEL
jgi:hypothetical protein